jgi:hypothetical protein
MGKAEDIADELRENGLGDVAEILVTHGFLAAHGHVSQKIREGKAGEDPWNPERDVHNLEVAQERLSEVMNPDEEEDRYWLLEALEDEDTSETNRLNEVAVSVTATHPGANEFPVVGLVDEKIGGVIGYLHADFADAICLELNLAQS